MTEFIEIKENDWCYICKQRYNEVLNLNDHTFGYLRLCRNCITSLVHNEENRNKKKYFAD